MNFAKAKTQPVSPLHSRLPLNLLNGVLCCRPEHPFSERWNVSDEDYPAILAQPIVHWLANFLSVSALAGIRTLNELLQIRPPPGCKFRVLEFADHILDEPVFPTWSASGKTSCPRDPTAWGQDANNLAKRSGHTNGLGFHSARRTALFNCNSESHLVSSKRLR